MKILHMFALRRFFQSERALSAVEYALIAALIALIVLGGARYLGTAVNTKFSVIGSAV